MAQDYYVLLGVSQDASTQEIKRAFRQIARECHPDVSGDDPAAEARFKAARKAYETLMDPITRARYDRRGQRRSAPSGGSFFEAFWERTGETSSRRHRTRGGHSSTGNDLDLDDLVNGFGGSGFGQSTSSAGRRGSPEPERFAPKNGGDVEITLEITPAKARGGGSVTAVYYRLQRADSWRPGALDPGLVRVQDIADIRIIPGTRDGEVLRQRGLGDAGAHGGAFGDLVIRVTVAEPAPSPAADRAPKATPSRKSAAPPDSKGAVDETPAASPTSTERPPAQQTPGVEPSDVATETGDVVVEVGIVEALLGGRVTVPTPQGDVKITVPPCTSGGTRLRLAGKGDASESGEPGDLHVVVRIVVPQHLDAESRGLIIRFAALNPASRS